jgi:predicted acetyltransferase
MSMLISVRDARNRKDDRAFVERSLRDYLEDLGGMNSGVYPALQEFGHREPDQLASWLGDRKATLLTIINEQQPVGFALVVQESPALHGVDYRMSEFFIARAARQRGFGRNAVRLIFDRFAGQWEVVQNQRNPTSVDFWRRVISQYTGGAWRERIANGEVRQSFRSGTKAARRT